MKKGIANFVYNFSEAQWSWIEQNMERLQRPPHDFDDRTWSAHIHMDKLSKYSEMVNLIKKIEKIMASITADEWDNYSSGVEVTIEDVLNAESWVKEKFNFLATIDYWTEEITYKLSSEIGQSMMGRPMDRDLRRWLIIVRKYQSNNTWSLRRGLAHEFADIIWLRAHGKTWYGLTPNNQGHRFAERWVYLHFHRRRSY